MFPVDKWWRRQLLEKMKEVPQRFETFHLAEKPDVDDLDKAQAIFHECCIAYELTEITFEEFVEFGESLRARQVSL